MTKYLLKGLKLGLLAGVCYWVVDTFIMFAVMAWQMSNPTTGFVPETAWLLLGSILVWGVSGALAGAVLGAAFGGPIPAIDAHFQRVRTSEKFLRIAGKGPLLGLTRVESSFPLQLLLLASVPLHGMVLYVSPEVDDIMGVGILILHLGIALFVLLGTLWAWRRPVAVGVMALILAGWVGFQNKGSLWGGVARTEPQPTAPPPVGAPNIVWIVLDTTRRDHLPMYGAQRETTPHMAKMANEGVVFDRAYATAPWTLESHAGMFSGMYGTRHQCTHETLFLNFQYSTLAEVLRDSGYNTSLFAGNPWLQDFTGLAQGHTWLFPSWRTYTLSQLFVLGRLRNKVLSTDQDKGAEDSNRKAASWLEERGTDRPFFMFFNYLEAHAPYYQIPPEAAMKFQDPGVSEDEVGEISRNIMSDMMFSTGYQADERSLKIAKDTYDGALWYLDQRVAEVVEMVRARGQLDNTLFVINADHGELFGKGGIWGHELSLDEGLIHVPLIVWGPGLVPGGKRVDIPVQLIDILPTLVATVGDESKIPTEVQGQSLWPVMNGEGDTSRPVYSEYFTPTHPVLQITARKLGMDPTDLRIKSVMVGHLKYVRGPGKKEALYDLSQDPDEQKNLAADQPEEVKLLSALVDKMVVDSQEGAKAGGQGGTPAMDKATEERLRALGYIR